MCNLVCSLHVRAMFDFIPQQAGLKPLTIKDLGNLRPCWMRCRHSFVCCNALSLKWALHLHSSCLMARHAVMPAECPTMTLKTECLCRNPCATCNSENIVIFCPFSSIPWSPDSGNALMCPWNKKLIELIACISNDLSTRLLNRPIVTNCLQNFASTIQVAL